MNKLAWIVCNSFLNKTGPKKKSSLVRFLPKSEQEIIKTVESETLKTLSCNFDEEKTLNLVHPSWHASFLRSLSETEVGLFLSCLPPFVSEKLKKALLYSRPLDKLSSISERYFRSILIKNLFHSNQDVLPLECLGDSPLKELLTFSNEHLHSLIEFLGLHDLSVEIKQIIDTSLLKKIQAALTVEKDSYLKSLSQKKEPVLFKRLDLYKWDGKPETLEMGYRNAQRPFTK